LAAQATAYYFLSISGSYTDLVLIYTKSATTDNLAIQVNGDTGTNYSNTFSGNGSTAQFWSFIQVKANMHILQELKHHYWNALLTL
jgi:hypothetical protein